MNEIQRVGTLRVMEVMSGVSYGNEWTNVVINCVNKILECLGKEKV